MLFSADDVTINGYTFDAGSSTEFTLGLGAGYELPLSAKLMLDLSGAFILISDANNIGVRAGIKWGL
jgi:opacity protein-like surface antigen